MNRILILSFYILSFFTSHINGQQNYSGSSAKSCNNDDKEGHSPAFLYTCNGQDQSCQSFLIFISQSPYDTVLSISNLTTSIPEELARINNVTTRAVFPTNKEVIVPVNCSCYGRYYQANTTYILNPYETYSIISSEIYEGLSTCNSLKRNNPYGELDLKPRMKLQVPLRCACPTRNQTANGAKYLLTYLVNWDDNVPDIAQRFNVSLTSILDANGFSEENPPLVLSTTILIPLPTEPSSSQTIIRHHQPVISPPSSDSKSNGKFRVDLAIMIGGFSLLFCVILSAIFLFYKMRYGFPQLQLGGRGKAERESETLRVQIGSFDQVLKVFEFEEIKKATEDFSSNNRMHEQSSVYLGEFGGKILAVKKMSTDASKEVKMLKKINHFNLIKLEGVCGNYGCVYLLYEYMENGSLKEWLRGNSYVDSGSWTNRIQIALDVANGLHYLHNFTEPFYIHMDVRSSNILLNGDLRAKISNFSIAREAAREVARTGNGNVTGHVVGTRGYMAPEFQMAGVVTTKIDVYAFGVVILELITGKNAITMQDGKEVLLSALIVSVMEGGNAEAELVSFLDHSFKGNNNGTEIALRMANLSVACLTQDPVRRPSMREVVSTLLKIQADSEKTESLSVDFLMKK